MMALSPPGDPTCQNSGQIPHQFGGWQLARRLQL